MSSLQARLQAHEAALKGVLENHAADVATLGERMAKCFEAGHKIMFAGNGGSACDAMHIAGEFVGRFVHDRRALAAIALSADTGIITAVANDYDYARIFSRQVEALGKPGDMLIAMSTSGKSPNILAALESARERQIETVLLTGEKASNAKPVADVTIIVPSEITAHIQEAHLFILHSLAALVEQTLGLDAHD
jgi:D-sedoheptulose 7-phosphate isomerase